MHSGSFDEVVLIYTYTTTQNENTGGVVKSWSLLNTVWARVKPSDSGFEGVNAERRENKQRVTFEMRYLPPVDPNGGQEYLTLGEKLYFEGNYYNIISKREIDRRMYLRLDTELTDEIYPTEATVQGFLRISASGLLRISANGLLKI